MIIIRVMGGFGNQLYQYALYEKMKSLGKDVKLDITDYLEGAREPEKRAFELPSLDHLPFALCTKKERARLADDSRSLPARVRRRIFGSCSKRIRETKDYMPELFAMDDVYLSGFWNCEKYYTDIIPMLQQTIKFSENYPQKTKDLLQRIKGEQAVSIHVRCGDYIDKSSFYGNICTKEYYQGAIAYLKERIDNPVFYLFSDEPNKAVKFLPEEKVIPVDWNTGKDSLYDMLIMSKCKHNICANSTFSMWGARLNTYEEKSMIRPFRHDTSQAFTPDYMHDTWSGWVLLDEAGLLC